MNARVVRLGLAVLAAPQFVIGVWAWAAPRAWYDSFPGMGHAWVAPLGSYDEHLARDAGAGFLALGVLLGWAAIAPRARLTTAALASWLAFAVPHLLHHLTAGDTLSRLDSLLSIGGLVFEVAQPLVLVALVVGDTRGGARGLRASTRVQAEGTGPATDEVARIAGRPAKKAGPTVRFAYWYARRMLGKIPVPLTVAAHHSWVFRGYTAYEFAAQRFRAVDARLGALAGIKAAGLVGCPF